MDLKQLTDKTVKITNKFSRKWGKHTRFVDLVEEVGEIANAILVKEGKKPKKTLHKGNSLEDALSDTLFNLILLAHQYNIDLETEYIKMLKKLDKRIKSGEFDK
ncbi:MazG nucleotide pyrophosphohydrolase domain-containing protein [Patescibacteria group bacterium]